MLSQFKKVALSVAMLGCAVGVQADNKLNSKELRQAIRTELYEIAQEQERAEYLNRMEYEAHMLNTEFGSLDSLMLALAVIVGSIAVLQLLTGNFTPTIEKTV